MFYFLLSIYITTNTNTCLGGQQPLSSILNGNFSSLHTTFWYWATKFILQAPGEHQKTAWTGSCATVAQSSAQRGVQASSHGTCCTSTTSCQLSPITYRPALRLRKWNFMLQKTHIVHSFTLRIYTLLQVSTGWASKGFAGLASQAINRWLCR